jgi:hypothetical protein
MATITTKKPLLIGFLSASVGFLSMAGLAPKETTDEKLIMWVQKRVQDAQPTRSERKFDEVGWAKDIRDAERLAKLHQRPIFLFTHDGRINTARC